MILYSTYSACKDFNGIFQIDRKFHTGMCHIANTVPIKFLVLAPKIREDRFLMDSIDISLGEVPYDLITIECDANYQPTITEKQRIEHLVRECVLVYGTVFDTHKLALKFKKPFIAVIENDLPTKIEVARQPAKGFLRKASRTIKTIAKFYKGKRFLRQAHSIHCNGFPVYQEAKKYHKQCLLYLDSRMTDELIIKKSKLIERCKSFESGRKAKILYSGRYESIKGAPDVIKVGIHLHKMGYDFELNLYGKGSLKEKMISLIEKNSVEFGGLEDTINVNDPISFPELVNVSKEHDIFICCHTQDDPSCTYLEAMGAGLPIIGYKNKMWQALSQESKVGMVTPLNNSKKCAEAIGVFLDNRQLIHKHSLRAQEYAITHSFEKEFKKRIEALEMAL